jgi:small subunit ribosomal protein S9
LATPAQYLGTGKRKTSVARVILRPGSGATWVNGKSLDEYFPRMVHRMLATSPLKTAGLDGQYDLRVRVHGGGPSGQAGAVRHGIARALVEVNPELRVPLKRAGFLTRDARQVEREQGDGRSRQHAAEDAVASDGDDAAREGLLEPHSRCARITSDEDLRGAGPRRRRAPQALDELRSEELAHDSADTVGAEVPPGHEARRPTAC